MSSSTERTSVILASRASQLAQVQTHIVLSSLQSSFPSLSFDTSFMRTAGDKNQSAALYLLGGKSLWTGELETALLEGSVDMLVHSFKDVPTVLPEGCIVGAILERESPVDCLVVKEGEKWKSLEELPEGSVVGTSSVRRVAQLKRQFPKLVFADVRGNLNTRLSKLDAPTSPFSALILAKAGLVRLGLGSRITSDLTPPTLFHAVAQGALAVEIRSSDARALELCAKLTHWETEWCCMAERACLRVLEGGCSVPVGVESKLDVDVQKGEGRGGLLTLTGCVTALDGSRHVEHTVRGEVRSKEDAEGLGKRLARTLVDTGAKSILEDISKDREKRTAEKVEAEA